MQDQAKAQLLEELTALRKRIGELEQNTSQVRVDKTFVQLPTSYSQILNIAPIWFWAANAQATEIYLASSGAKVLTGYEPEEFIKNPPLWFQLIPEEDQQIAIEANERARREKVTTSFECRIKHRDGTIRWMHDVVIPKCDESGNLIGLHGYAIDITERKRAEERLAKINDCFLGFGTDSDVNINRLTALCGTLLGATCALYNRLDHGLLCSLGQWQTPKDYNPVDEPEGHICYDVIKRGGDQILVVRNLSETIYARTDPNVVRYGLHTYIGKAVKRGAAYIGSLCAVFQMDFNPSEEEKKIIGIIASAIGAEEERRQVEQTRDYQARLLDQVSDAIIATDLEGKIVSWNAGAEALYGWSAAEVMGQSITILDTQKAGVQATEIISTALSEGIWSGDERKIRKDGREIFIHLTVTQVRDRQGRMIGLVGISQDITEQKQGQEALTETNKRLAHALDRLQQLSHHVLQIQENEYRFISRELHDNIAQSLNAVKMKLERLERDANLGLKDYRRQIQATVSQLRKISQDVRGLSKKMRPEILDELGLIATLEPYIKDFQRSTGIQVEFMLQTTNKQLSTDITTHLYRIVQEALNNVAKHAKASYILINLQETEKNLSLSIMDNGIGFSLDQWARGKKTPPGIGLISIQERVNLLKGTIDILSSPGNGTKISVNVPLLA